jgi:magnesium chelatase subunit I
VPPFLNEVVATFSHLARQSPHVNQRSGVSVRMTVANTETLVANAARRALRLGETDVVPRIADLDALASSTQGKIEIESIDEGRDGQVVEHLLRAAVLTVFRERLPIERLRAVLDAFDSGQVVHTGDDLSSADEAALVEAIPALREPVLELTGGDESPAAIASAVEFVLEGLHLSKRLNKDTLGGKATYRGR